MKKKWTYVFNVLLMIVILVLTFSVLFGGQDVGEILQIVKKSEPKWLLCALVCGILFLVLQAVSIYWIIQSLGIKSSLFSNIKYTFICFFYNAITPSASGGQPMQIYYMKQDGIPLGASSVALLFWTIIYKIALLLLEAYVFLFQRHFLHRMLGQYYWLFLLGIMVNFVSVILYSIVVFSKNGVRKLAYLGTWICHKMRIIRKKKKFMARVDHTLALYEEGAVYMRSHWGIFVKVLLITLVQRIAFFAITWFVYLALGQRGMSFLELVMMQSFVAVCIDIIPLPGGVGANEGFFVQLFAKIMDKKMVFSAMLLSRGVSFYALVLIGIVVTVYAQFKIIVSQKRKQKKRNGD